MISWLSEKMSDKLVGSGTVSADDRDIYVYGMDVILSTVANIICILAIGLVIGRTMASLLYLLFFSVLRGTTGGFHASTHFRCLVILLVSFGIAMGLLFLLPADVCRWATLPIVAVSVAAVFALAPAPHENKPVSGAELVKFRRMSLGVAAAEALVVVLLLVLNAVPMAFACSLGMLTSAGSLCAATVTNTAKRKAAQDEAR